MVSSLSEVHLLRGKAMYDVIELSDLLAIETMVSKDHEMEILVLQVNPS